MATSSPHSTTLVEPQLNEARREADFDRGLFIRLGALGAVVGFVVPAIAYLSLRGTVPSMADAADRLAFTLRWMALPVLSIVVGVQAAGFRRFTSPNVDGSDPPAGSALQLHRRYLQNTLERFTIFFVAMLGFAVVAPIHSLHLIPVLAVQFLLARLLFWRGYLHRPAFRSFGIALDGVNLVVLGYVLVRLIA